MHFYRAMHFSAKLGIVIACRLSVCLSGDIQRIHPNKSLFKKYLGKRERGRIQGLPNFLGTHYYLRNGKSYGFQILHAHLWAQSQQKPIKNSEKLTVVVVKDS